MPLRQRAGKRAVLSDVFIEQDARLDIAQKSRGPAVGNGRCTDSPETGQIETCPARLRKMLRHN